MKASGKAEKALFIAVLGVLAGIFGGVFSAPFKKGINVYTERERFPTEKESFQSFKLEIKEWWNYEAGYGRTSECGKKHAV